MLIILYFFALGIPVSAQDSTMAVPSLNLRYFIENNSLQYFLVQSRIKKGKKFMPLPGQFIRLYLDSNNTGNLISRTVTNEKGVAKIVIPPALQDKWKNRTQHNFIAVLETTSSKDAITSTIEITRAKIELDTSNAGGERTVNVKVMFLENNNWVPAKDVEMKVGVARAGGILSAGDEQTYTTDSSGITTVPFKRDSLPGDQYGNFVLVAKVEDNELYGNLLVEKKVPWGIVVKSGNNFFDQRTLWSTRFRTPWWLLFLAYSIVTAVWGTIIFLILQIVKIKKLGAKAN